MKNFTKLKRRIRGHEVYRIIDLEGDLVAAFDDFVEFLITQNFATSTIRRYSDAVANFLDYLVEGGVFGQPATPKEINHLIDSYVAVKMQADRIRSIDIDDEIFSQVRPIVIALKMRQVSEPGNMIAAINRFLRRSELLAYEDWQIAEQMGMPKPSGSYRALIDAVNGYDRMPYKQRKALKQNSMLANVMRYNVNGINRPKRIRSPKPGGPDDEVYLDFPLEFIKGLINAATSARDRALWLLLAGTGIRMSEAMNLQWEDIDCEAQKVFVHDPHTLRFDAGLAFSDKMRFKGRAMAATAFIPQLKFEFFKSLADYFKHEMIAGVVHQFVFQQLRGSKAGEPMLLLSDTARIESFKRAVIRAGISSCSGKGKVWTPHSLRHLYGVYMLNYLPVPGGFGLRDVEVQQLMGHQTLTATRHYARENKEILNSKLLHATAMAMEDYSNLETLPAMIAKRLRHEADKIDGVKS